MARQERVGSRGKWIKFIGRSLRLLLIKCPTPYTLMAVDCEFYDPFGLGLLADLRGPVLSSYSVDASHTASRQ